METIKEWIARKLLGHKVCYACAKISQYGSHISLVEIDYDKRPYEPKVEKLWFCIEHRHNFEVIVGTFGRYSRKNSWAFWRNGDPKHWDKVDDEVLQKWFAKLYD